MDIWNDFNKVQRQARSEVDVARGQINVMRQAIAHFEEIIFREEMRIQMVQGSCEHGKWVKNPFPEHHSMACAICDQPYV